MQTAAGAKGLKSDSSKASAKKENALVIVIDIFHHFVRRVYHMKKCVMMGVKRVFSRCFPPTILYGVENSRKPLQ